MIAEETTPVPTSNFSQCFHCGLPVNAPTTERLKVLGEQRSFCCHGCKAVCKTIVDSGLESYYTTRDIHPDENSRIIQQDLLERLAIYDNENVQKSFVHTQGDGQEAYLILEGIRCSACVWLNELHLRQQPGVIDVHIDEVTQRARVRWNPQQISLSQILATIAAIGYQAHPYEPSHYLELQKQNRRKNLQRILYAALIGMIPMQFALASWLMGGADEQGKLPEWELVGRWISMLTTLTILVYPAQDFFFGAWSDLKRRVIGMDVPIVLGLSGAYLLSVYSTLTASGEVYYESIVMFVLFILVSRRLEQKARVRASDQLDRLALSQPVDALRLLPDDSVERVTVLDLQRDDRIQIVPGDKVPVDCEIIQGASSFDESLISGESTAIRHAEGDRLIAGSVNYDQPVQARVLAGELESTIAEITRLAESGLQQKPVQAQLADRVAARFVLFILTAALLTGGYWFMQGSADWAVYAVSVLIVTCPCALALATPIALTLSTSRYLKKGLLALNMSVLNKMRHIDYFVFDKTGTLTRGKPTVTDLLWVGKADKTEALTVLNALTVHSGHPLAKAIRLYLDTPPVKLNDVLNHVGMGLQGEHKGDIWRFGSIAYISSAIGSITPQHSQWLDKVAARNCTVSCLTRNNQLVAAVLFQDSVREGSEGLIQWLKEMAITPVILSGDAAQTVAHLANELGILECHGNMSAQQKMDWVRSRQQQGKIVAMAGDGINDAPTLACADVSFSLSESTALANNHSDFLLLNKDLKAISEAIQLAHKTLKVIRLNFAWAIVYNLIAVPFAMAGWVPPWAAAIGMSTSSIIVVINSMHIN